MRDEQDGPRVCAFCGKTPEKHDGLWICPRHGWRGPVLVQSGRT